MASTITPPPGRRALAMNNKQMTDQYKVKTGPGRKDTLSHKLFLKTEMMCVGWMPLVQRAALGVARLPHSARR